MEQNNIRMVIQSMELPEDFSKRVLYYREACNENQINTSCIMKEVTQDGGIYNIHAVKDGYWLIIPLEGGISVSHSNKNTVVKISQLYRTSMIAGDTFAVESPKKNLLPFSFIYICFETEHTKTGSRVVDFPMIGWRNNPNSINLGIQDDLPFCLRIGILCPKYTAVLPCDQRFRLHLCHIIEGCCEIGGCLLFKGDSLEIIGRENLKIEGIAGISIMLLVEFDPY
ncbi:MAG: hypothetical protein ACN6ON_06175 [Sphingobacterium sp.]